MLGHMVCWEAGSAQTTACLALACRSYAHIAHQYGYAWQIVNIWRERSGIAACIRRKEKDRA